MGVESCQGQLLAGGEPVYDAGVFPLTSDDATVSLRLGVEGIIALDWKDFRLVGIEILDASRRPR